MGMPIERYDVEFVGMPIAHSDDVQFMGMSIERFDDDCI
jgi:hypothetical protein